MSVSIIAAVAANGVIGKDNDLPWKLPDDMKYFQKTTLNHPVIMGRKNWESIPEKYRPLKDRQNVIITRNNDYVVPEGVLMCSDIHTILWTLDSYKNIIGNETFIIGGAEIYKLAFPYVNKLYLTEIRAEIDGNVYFPPFNAEEWEETSRIHHPIDEKHKYAFDFVEYVKK